MAMGISITSKGNWKKTTDWMMNAKEQKFMKQLYKYGEKGVEALAQATPIDSGKTAMSWDYEIHWSKGAFTINWTNSNMARERIPIAILIQYGHATRNGGFVKGVDYINPALTPIFEKLANDAWEEVTK
jgi:hypothetical protein